MTPQQEAIERAQARPEQFYVRYWFDPGMGFELPGPMPEADADDIVSRLLLIPGIKLSKLRVVEDYYAASE